MQSNRLNRLAGTESHAWLTYLQYVCFGSLILYFGRDVLIPLSFAVLISFVLYPSCAWLERKGVGRMTAIVINVSMLTLLGLAISVLMIQQFVNFVEEWPGLQGKLLATWDELNSFLTAFFGVSPEQQDKFLAKLTDQVADGAWTFIRNAISFSAFSAVMLILVPVYVVLILYYRHHWVKVLYRLFPAERNENTKQILVLTIHAYFSFIKGMGIVYLTVGILNSVGLMILGVPHAILFGFIASVLTFIPYVGILIGSLLPITMAWTTYDSVWYPLGVVGIFTFVQYLEANVIFPIAVSNRLKVNTLVVLMAIFVGGLLWGVSGMILFVPFVGIAKLIADRNYKLKTLSMLLGVQNNKSAGMAGDTDEN